MIIIDKALVDGADKLEPKTYSIYFTLKQTASS